MTLRHASNLRGPWVLDERASDPASSLTLIVMVRVSGILSVGNGDNSNNNGDDESEVLAAIATVPVDGSPSRRTGEPFDCRTWVKDVLVALRDHGCITLSADIGKSCPVLAYVVAGGGFCSGGRPAPPYPAPIRPDPVATSTSTLWSL